MFEETLCKIMGAMPRPKRENRGEGGDVDRCGLGGRVWTGWCSGTGVEGMRIGWTFFWKFGFFLVGPALDGFLMNMEGMFEMSGLIPKHGGYRKLKSFQVAQWIVTAAKQHGEGSDDGASLYPEYSANATLSLLAVACALLDRQVEGLAKNFEDEGGFTERLYHFRKGRRGR